MNSFVLFCCKCFGCPTGIKITPRGTVLYQVVLTNFYGIFFVTLQTGQLDAIDLIAVRFDGLKAVAVAIFNFNTTKCRCLLPLNVRRSLSRTYG